MPIQGRGNMTDTALDSNASRGEFGEVDLALAMRLEALKINQALGSRMGIAKDFGRLAVLYIQQGDLDQAEKMLSQAIEIEQSLGRKDNMARHCADLARVHLSRGELERAESLFRQSQELDLASGRKEKAAESDRQH
ncbi:MAG: tetratricopeptide repeat protein [Deltaproteobacteria bacterium]|nr:tetratricopeptide repeat protein [Deltaproteobacteria bacterium]